MIFKLKKVNVLEKLKELQFYSNVKGEKNQNNFNITFTKHFTQCLFC